jgi:hypothetical protein
MRRMKNLSFGVLRCANTPYYTMDFEIIGNIRHAETFARGSGIRELPRLRKIYGIANWRKRKGIASIRLADGSLREAEIHWYEATGIGNTGI